MQKFNYFDPLSEDSTHPTDGPTTSSDVKPKSKRKPIRTAENARKNKSYNQELQNRRLQAEIQRLKEENYILKAEASDHKKTIRKAIDAKMNAQCDMMRNIDMFREVEVKAIKQRMKFVKCLKKRVKKFDADLEVNVFGGFIRRALQRRSLTTEEHERFMTYLKESDIDMRVYYNKETPSDMIQFLRNLDEYGINLEVLEIRRITSTFQEDLMDYTDVYHTKCIFHFKGEEIKADIFNRYFINFSTQDYSSNQISMEKDGFTINRENGNIYQNRDYGMEMLETMMEFQTMTTRPLFVEESTGMDRRTRHNMNKMITRQSKMIREGFTPTQTIIGADEDEKNCLICYEQFGPKEDEPEYVPPKRYGFALCGCSFGRAICRCCFKKWDTNCPQCKIPWKITMTKEALEESDFVLPDIQSIQLQGIDMDIYNNDITDSDRESLE